MEVSGRSFIKCLIVFLISLSAAYSQTTGKIAGMVLSKDAAEPVVGANIYLSELPMGASTDVNGDFFIINVPPGLYTLNIQMIGYLEYQIQDLRVSVNRTASVTVDLTPTLMEGEMIVVRADKMSSKKDQTGSIRNITSEQLNILPVENLQSVINMQAGVVDGHFRGGRSNEVSYLVDGMPVVDSYAGESSSVTLETEVVREVEVITGTFNAEYGRAMSGVVNAVTKDGQETFHGSFSSSISNYITGHNSVFPGLNKGDLDRQKDFKFQFSGPLWKDMLTFFINARLQDNNGYLNGRERFKVDDYSDFSQDDPQQWYSENTGSNKYVPMNYSKLNSFMGKITTPFFESGKLSFLFTRNDEEWGDYDHAFKYNPRGAGQNHKITDMYSLKFNQMLSRSFFYDINLSYLEDEYGWYVFRNPESSKYVHDAYLNNNGPGFYTGGQQKSHTLRSTNDLNAKLDLTWQLTKRHLFKSGFLLTGHKIDQAWRSIQNDFRTREEDENLFYFDYETNSYIFPNYEPVALSDSTIFSDIYTVKPIEFSAYIQDKMEFEEMVVNLGIRYDYFDPQTTYPSQRRNPANQLYFDDPQRMSSYPETKPQFQISPRLGLSYQLGKVAVLHFSYGHFFQMPPMYALYQNNSQRVAPNDYYTTMGNSQLEAQKTVQYEVGLWQELMPEMGLEVVVFYRDIYNLLSTKIISTFNQIEYGLYANKDYGNVKGLEVKWDYRTSNFMANVNYTLQYTRGNADNPTQTFNRAGESKDPIPTFIPMSWDQRNTFNATVGFYTEDYGATLTSYFNSGTPFSWNPLSENRVANINLLPNNSYQRSTYSLDLSGYYDIYRLNDMLLRLNFSVYNLLDRLNDSWVNSTTGRAYTAIIQNSDIDGHKSNFNEFSDRIKNPSMYRAPRLIKAGLEVSF